MTFTALHRAAGVGPRPLTDEILNAAVEAGAIETGDLDWKAKLPPMKGLPQTDFPKDVAAMANTGGGVIVFGVAEEQKAATGRVDVGPFDENHERALRSAAITAISPPVFSLSVHRLGADGNRAVVVEIPASIDGPHLIYRNEYFGAPVRNDADTVWMKERQIEAMYRTRFEERRHSTETLDTLFTEASVGRSVETRAWLVVVAHPRLPRIGERLTRDRAREVLVEARKLAPSYAGSSGIHPLENVDYLNPRPGLRRWVAMNTARVDVSQWKESWISIHHDGSVTLAAAVGGRPRGHQTPFDGGQVGTAAVECAIADAMAVIRATAEATGNDEYDVRVGIPWRGVGPLTILTTDRWGEINEGGSIPLYRYTPVEMSINAAEPEADFYRHVHDLAQDCVNQGGISNLQMIRPPGQEDADD